jgi:hypothetical protein
MLAGDRYCIVAMAKGIFGGLLGGVFPMLPDPGAFVGSYL